MTELKKVCDGVYRSAYPSYNDLYFVQKEYGVTHVLNLQNRGDVDELDTCEALGLHLFDMDLNGLLVPTLEETELAMRLIADHQPILIHCWAGRERTGYMCAAYKILCGTAPQLAYDEMIANGCRWPNSWLYKKRLGL